MATTEVLLVYEGSRKSAILCTGDLLKQLTEEVQKIDPKACLILGEQVLPDCNAQTANTRLRLQKFNKRWNHTFVDVSSPEEIKGGDHLALCQAGMQKVGSYVCIDYWRLFSVSSTGL